MKYGYTDAVGREFIFKLNGDRWECLATGENFSIRGEMPVVKAWDGEIVATGKALYRMGAGAKLYTMAARDEIELEADHLGFLEQTGRHSSRIKKSRERLDWLYRLQASGIEMMDVNWKQGVEVKL